MEKSESSLDKAAEEAANAAFELEIAQDTRNFLSEIRKENKKGLSPRLGYIMGIAASLLIIVVSYFTVNMTLSDDKIANKYSINKIVYRSGENVYDEKITDAVQDYYAEKYTSALSIIESIENPNQNVTDTKDYLLLLIELKTEGSNTERFTSLLDDILDNPDHKYYPQAIEMKKDLENMWRWLVI